jgi:hypothetical protein
VSAREKSIRTREDRPPIGTAGAQLVELIDELIRTMDDEEDQDDGPTERLVMMRLDTRPPIRPEIQRVRATSGPPPLPPPDDEIALSEDSLLPTQV